MWSPLRRRNWKKLSSLHSNLTGMQMKSGVQQIAFSPPLWVCPGLESATVPHFVIRAPEARRGGGGPPLGPREKAAARTGMRKILKSRIVMAVRGRRDFVIRGVWRVARPGDEAPVVKWSQWASDQTQSRLAPNVARLVHHPAAYRSRDGDPT